MARKKGLVWRAGRYFRLSREDGDKVESESIESQRGISKDWLASNADISIVDDYIDDGWSGTNFDRPGFQRMLEDIQEKRIDCVIVKDLSRFGRNYIEVGRYLEMVFPRYNVRFIAINDRIDSYEDPYSINNAIVPFKNVMNDEYCRDISNKVRSSLTTRRKQGKFIGSFAPYGYKKDPENHSHLIVDEETRKNVELIFDMFLAGTGVIGIAKCLNKTGIQNPSSYKRDNGYNYKHPCSAISDGMWTDASVRRVLRNRVYVGDTVQGKNRIKSYKIKISESIPSEDWIIVENTHEPIIPRETFDKVQDIFERRVRAQPATGTIYPFSGFLKCADCKRAMNRKLISQPYKNYCYYVCATFKKMDESACTKHTIRSDKLEEAVIASINAQASFAIEMESILERVRSLSRELDRTPHIREMISVKEAQRSKNVLCVADLYPDWKSGVISQEEFVAIKTKLTDHNRQLENEIHRLQEELARTADKEFTNDFIEHFKKYRAVSKITREIVVELIDVIYVHEGGEITIVFKYQDEYKRLMESAEKHGRDLVS